MRTRTVVASVLIGFVTAGCGGGSSGEASKSAQQVVSDASHAAAAASTVHVVGTATVQGQQVPVDLRLTADGSGVGTSQFAGTRVDLVRKGDSVYVRGAQKVFAAFLGAKAAAVIDGHWVQISTSLPQLQQFASTTDMKALVRQALTPSKTPGKTGTQTVDGRKVVAVSGFGTDGSGTLLVAASGTPYPVRMVTRDGVLNFRDWNQTVQVTVPTDVVPLSRVAG